MTGDHPSTAVAIAAQAGIISNPATVHHASDLLDPPATPDKESGEKDKDGVIVTRDQDDNAPPQSIVITGAELEKLTPEQENTLCSYQEIVFARTTPEQKLRIVRSMQARDGVVGVSGDDVNDALALRAADCGIAWVMVPTLRVRRLTWSSSRTSLPSSSRWSMVRLFHLPKPRWTASDSLPSFLLKFIGRLVYDNLKKTILYLLPAGR